MAEVYLIKNNPREDLAIMALYDEANKLLEYANNRVIATLDDTKAATNDLSLIAKLKKAMEAKRGEGVGGMAGVVGDEEEATDDDDIQDDEVVENER